MSRRPHRSGTGSTVARRPYSQRRPPARRSAATAIAARPPSRLGTAPRLNAGELRRPQAIPPIFAATDSATPSRTAASRRVPASMTATTASSHGATDQLVRESARCVPMSGRSPGRRSRRLAGAHPVGQHGDDLPLVLERAHPREHRRRGDQLERKPLGKRAGNGVSRALSSSIRTPWRSHLLRSSENPGAALGTNVISAAGAYWLPASAPGRRRRRAGMA